MGALSFTCEATAFAKALRDVRSCVRGRSDIPILNNVLIEAAGDVVRITASDMNLTAVRTMPAQVQGEGRITIEGDRLADIVGALNSGSQAQLEEVDGGRATLVSGRSRFRFATLPAADYPTVPAGEPVAALSLSAADLARALGTVRHAVSNDKTRYFLNGVHISAGEDGLRYLSSDGTRAARWMAPLPDGGASVPPTLLSSAFVDAMIKALGDFEGEVALTFTDRLVRAELGAFAISGKPVDGQFPDVERLIPPDPPTLLSADADGLAAALRRIALMRTDREGALKLAVEKESITVSGVSQATGEEGVEQLPCEYGGQPLDIAFRSQLLREAISALDVDVVEFGITATFGAPVRLRSAARPEATLLVMPFRL